MPDSQRVPISSLVFGGINQNVEETNLRTDESPDLLNVYLHPFGTASGREGMLAAAGDPVGGASGGTI